MYKGKAQVANRTYRDCQLVVRSLTFPLRKMAPEKSTPQGNTRLSGASSWTASPSSSSRPMYPRRMHQNAHRQQGSHALSRMPGISGRLVAYSLHGDSRLPNPQPTTRSSRSAATVRKYCAWYVSHSKKDSPLSPGTRSHWSGTPLLAVFRLALYWGVKNWWSSLGSFGSRTALAYTI